MSAVSSPAAPLRLRCKVLLLGESTVGKTSICQTYCSNGTEFPKNYLMTICCDLQVKVVQIPDSTVSVELFIYDCSGQDIFRDQLAQVLDGTCAVVYVYDVTRRETFEQLFQWVRLVADARKGLKPLKGTVVANKLDVQDRISVHANDGAQFAKSHDLEFAQVCAQKLPDVEPIFSSIAAVFHQQYQEALSTLASIV